MATHSRGGTVKPQGGAWEILDRAVAIPTSRTSPQPEGQGEGLGNPFLPESRRFQTKSKDLAIQHLVAHGDPAFFVIRKSSLN